MTLEEILVAKEGENYEFKKAERHFEFIELCKYASALSNQGGGRIIFGVTDARPRQVVGSKAFEQPERTRKGLMDALKINVDFQLFNEGQPNRVLVFIIPGRPLGLPVMYNGVAWWREGDSLVPMPAQVMRTIFAEAASDFSAQICDEARMDDLSPVAINEFRKRWADKSKRDEILDFPDDQILRDSEAVTAKGITNAAVILFGTKEAVGRLMAQSEVVYEYRVSEEPGPADYREEYREGFFLCYDKIWNQVASRNTVQHYQDKFAIPDIPTFDERIVREIVLNAVSHRDYQLAPPVFVRQFAQRIEVDNPGGLPPDVTIENILERQSPRNRRIADIFAKCGLVERSGQGMDLIYSRSIRQAKALPDFSGTDRLHVKVTHCGLVEDPALVAMMAKIGRETLRGFSVRDLLVVHNIRKMLPVPTELNKNLDRVVSMGIIEKLSHGKFILGKRYYHQIGHSGVYTRQKGLKTEAAMALIVQHVEENNAEGSRYADFAEAFPSMPRSSLQKMLRQLRDAQKIMVLGERRGARWFIYDADKLYAYQEEKKSKTGRSNSN